MNTIDYIIFYMHTVLQLGLLSADISYFPLASILIIALPGLALTLNFAASKIKENKN